MTLDDLADRLFATAPEAADILGRDPRTVRNAARDGQIPGARLIGRKWLIPTQWLRHQAGVSAASASPGVDYDKLAELVNQRANALLADVFSQLAAAFGAQTEAV